MYAEQFDITDRETQNQSRTGTDRNRSNTQAELSRLAGELERVIQKRTEYNRTRYPQQLAAFGTQYQNGLSEYSMPFQQPIPQSSFMEHSNNPDNGLDNNRNNRFCPLPDQILENRATEFEGTDGKDRSGIHQSLEQVQRTGVIPLQGRELFADTAELADNLIRDKGKTECLENKQGLNVCQDISRNVKDFQDTASYCNLFQYISISQTTQPIKEKADDRTGTHTQSHIAVLAAGNNTNPNEPTITTQSTGTNPAKLDRANNISDRTKPIFTINFESIRRNLAALDQCVQQLKSLTSILTNISKKIKDRGISR